METTETSRTGMGTEESEKDVNVGRKERTASLLGGAGLAAYGVSQLLGRRYWRGAAMAVAGGMMLYRGKTGHCSLYQALGVNRAGNGGTAVDIRESVTVERPRSEAYRYWRNLENLPAFMKYIKSVTPLGDRRYHWVAETPGKVRAEWDAEITDELENEFIAWRSVPGSQVHHEGRVSFRDAGDGSTEVSVEMTYHPPEGASASLSKLFNFVTAGHIRKELKRFRKVMEKKRRRALEGETAAPAP